MSRNNTLSNSAFQTLTYSRHEVNPKPMEDPRDILELRLPRLTSSSRKSSSARKSSSKRKTSSLENFKTVTFPLSSASTANPTTTKDASLTAVQKLNEQYRCQTEEEKQEILMAAREQAAEIMATAEAEANKIKKEVTEKARDEGLKDAEKEVDSRIAQLDELLERLDSTQSYCRQKNEEEMVKLALSCARRLINREISLDENVIADCVREIFNENSVQGDLTLFLNSEDFHLIDEQRSQMLSDFPQINGLKVEIAEGIERGGCILESAMGRIDASLRSKFEELNRLLNSEQ